MILQKLTFQASLTRQIQDVILRMVTRDAGQGERIQKKRGEKCLF